MHSTVAFILALAAAATATPTTVRRTCGAPGTYRCNPTIKTIDVCDFDSNWKPLIPTCPPNHHCESDPFGTGIPYCMLDAPTPDPGSFVPGACTTPGQYTCTPGSGGIQVCDVLGKLQLVGNCPNYCQTIAGIPYCF
jgi:hypothetical protein